MGLTPGDVARLNGRHECAEFLLLYETSLSMSKELKDVQVKNEQLQHEQSELRGHFKWDFSAKQQLGFFTYTTFVIWKI